MSLAPHLSDALSAYVDGDLDAAATRAVAGHLADCAACRAVVADLERLRDEVRGWATDTALPAADLWPGIAARLSAPEATQARTTGAPSRAPVVPIAWYRRRVSLGVPELALAASLIAVLGGALIYQRGAMPAPVVGPTPVLAQLESFDAPDGGVASVSFADAQYDAAVSDLERVLQDQRHQLNPRTVLVLERNLRIIEEAVQEARAALASDPANPLLNAQLADVRQRKLQLLRKAALITEGD
jgi:anti-sigma factor RsiW